MNKKSIFAFLSISLVSLTNYAVGEERKVPERILPVPSTVSDQAKVLIGVSPSPLMLETPKTADEWRQWVAENAKQLQEAMPVFKRAFGVEVEKSQIANVPVFIVTPKVIKPENKNRIILHFHGGGYVLNPGEIGAFEAIELAGLGGYKVISVDYRMAPDYPYPAAMDDAFAVYSALVKQHDPKKIGVFGSSTGGGMTLALILRAKSEHIVLPAAIAPATPWSDLTKTGDSYFVNEGVDNVLVRYDGWLKGAAEIYANGHDMKDPQLSPVYGDYHDFPPTLLTSGTRDLFLSNTVRVHRKLIEAGVETDLVVFEGLSHVQFLFGPMPEMTEHFGDVSQFFDKHLQK